MSYDMRCASKHKYIHCTNYYKCVKSRNENFQEEPPPRPKKNMKIEFNQCPNETPALRLQIMNSSLKTDW